jgi:transcriptional regulator with XRE-family HTH domain
MTAARRSTPDDPTTDARSDHRAFNQWLRVQLKARNLSQRQLAQKSGVDHSTISRLTRGDRMPSLRTATMLVRGLSRAQDLGRVDDDSLGRNGSPAASVEYALRSDDLLSEGEVRRIMNVYLATRLRRHRGVATQASVQAPTRTPVPIVVEVPGLRPSATSIGRLPTAARGRSS